MRILVVDGYNAINKIPRISDISDRSLREARMAVTELARAFKKKSGCIQELYVVFDGRTEYRSQNIPRPSEHVFSDTGRGDKKIIEVNIGDIPVSFSII